MEVESKCLPWCLIEVTYHTVHRTGVVYLYGCICVWFLHLCVLMGCVVGFFRGSFFRTTRSMSSMRMPAMSSGKNQRKCVFYFKLLRHKNTTFLCINPLGLADVEQLLIHRLNIKASGKCSECIHTSLHTHHLHVTVFSPTHTLCNVWLSICNNSNETKVLCISTLISLPIYSYTFGKYNDIMLACRVITRWFSSNGIRCIQW